VIRPTRGFVPARWVLPAGPRPLRVQKLRDLVLPGEFELLEPLPLDFLVGEQVHLAVKFLQFLVELAMLLDERLELRILRDQGGRFLFQALAPRH
jgi:hypothetical protein